MTITGRDILWNFANNHADTKGALQAWVKEVECAGWKTPKDVKARFNSVDFRPGNRIIFNIKGNNYRLVVAVAYQASVVRVVWMGTHAEYDKMKF
jgi:mRNA interferase HigB